MQLYDGKKVAIPLNHPLVDDRCVVISLLAGGNAAVPLVAAPIVSGDRGVFAGSYGADMIDYIAISSLGNATDFGNLTIGRSSFEACSSGVRACFGGGSPEGSADSNTNIIDYITISTLGNAIDFGDLTVSRWGSSS